MLFDAAALVFSAGLIVAGFRLAIDLVQDSTPYGRPYPPAAQRDRIRSDMLRCGEEPTALEVTRDVASADPAMPWSPRPDLDIELFNRSS